MAKESEEAFWLFVDQWLKAGQQISPTSDSECFQLIVSRGVAALSDQLRPIFLLSLMLRSASPKLVLFRQLAQESLAYSPPNSGSLRAESERHDTDRWAVSKNPVAPEGKCCWVDVGSKKFFDEVELSDWLESLQTNFAEHRIAAELFEFDHIFAGSNGPNFVVVLYGALGTACFERLHSVLAEAAKQGLVKYVLRPVLPSGCEQAAGRCGSVGTVNSVNLGGYGVELALKNMEYTAIDDSDIRKGEFTDDPREDGSPEGEQAAVEEVDSLNKYLLSPEIVDLASSPELKDLGFQAVQKILGAPDPLRMMQDINQNLPKLVSWLANVHPNETIRSEILSNQRMIQAGKNLIAINGALINTDNVDIHSLIDLVQGELSIAVKLRQMKIPSLYVRRLLQIPEPPEQNTVRVDFRSAEFVHYLNNLEEDSMYKRWPNNMNALLMPVFPGQLRYVRKNLYHAVYVVDPASGSGLRTIDSMMNNYQSSVPMRFGLIFVAPKVLRRIELNLPADDALQEGEKDASSLAIQAFQYLKEHLSVQAAFEFLQNLASDYEYAAEMEGVSHKDVRGAFLEILKQHGNSGSEVLKEMQGSSYYREVPYKNSLHAYKLGVSRLHPCLLMNGLIYDESQVEHGALLAMQDELPRIQEGVYYGTINSRTDVLNKFLSDGSFPRFNPQIAGPASKEAKYVSLAEHIATKHVALSQLQYLHSPGTEDEVKPITHWLALNLMKASGWNLLREAVHYLSVGSSKGRVAILHNVEGNSSTSVKNTAVTILFAVTTSPSRRTKIVPFLERFLASKSLQRSVAGEPDEEELVKEALDIALETGFNAEYLQAFLADPSRIESARKQMSEEGVLLATLFGLQPMSDAVITNGKAFVQESGKYFLADDFGLLEYVEYEKRVKPVELIVSEVEWSTVEPDELTSDFLSTVILAISSSIGARSRSSESARFELLRGEYCAIVKDVSDTDIHVDAVIDPLSSSGQKLTPLLFLLQEWFNPSMRILLNPVERLTDLPLKNFYHYVAPVKENYMADGGQLTEGPLGHFLNMPPTRTLTMNLDVPEPWLVEPVIAIHDLDNIILQKLSGKTMTAVFELEALVVTGQCYENGEPPRGLQLLLGTRFAPHMVDTIVMANLGYWQLKAAPGVMTLKLAPGKSTELYTLKGPGEGTEVGPISKQLVIQSLRGAVVRLEVVKRKGKEGQKILDADDDLDGDLEDEARPKKKGKSKAGLLKWATNFIGMGKESDVHAAGPGVVSLGGQRIQRRGETINIFSIASGHLYERFLKIMMLSVLKNTRRPVKFWFIKNYLSPQFKDVIPHMAEWYGFEYDLVTYKWPSWLHKQTEKQRLIWAYKILFLDVIFPLSLKKVIFVDADQIVRTDMGELYDMDIDGRPLAYTPFCDNNREMDGYRFWNQGFWKDHLRGRPYHISALYVVDLARFRQSAAGDKLRVFYESLSRDPNSLSNLDQDLPNYAQHTVPIFSLPQQWLWCESWCGNATKAQAKTIDLCNNPMTKEPKLEGARRIVDEWPALDEEAREFTARILHGDVGHTPAAPAPVEVGVTDPGRDLETAAEL